MALWLCFVWGHSLANADLSSAESSRFVGLLRPLFLLAGIHDEGIMTLVIRKTAHFSEYAVLGALLWNMAYAWHAETGRAWLLFAVLWVAAPSVDETIQLFVPGRSGMVTDVIIDMCGGLVGLAVAYALRRRGRGTG